MPSCIAFAYVVHTGCGLVTGTAGGGSSGERRDHKLFTDVAHTDRQHAFKVLMKDWFPSGTRSCERSSNRGSRFPDRSDCHSAVWISFACGPWIPILPQLFDAPRQRRGYFGSAVAPVRRPRKASTTSRAIVNAKGRNLDAAESVIPAEAVLARFGMRSSKRRFRVKVFF